MKCQKCQAENRSGRRFCAKCGGALGLACPSCGAENDPADDFCGACGAPLAAETALRPAPAAAPAAAKPEAADGRSERRQVAILFADLSGFTKLSQTQDPEETQRVLNRFFELVDGTVELYGGTIDKHIGDGAMALFGAPAAHSNDHERAVRAAVDIHKGMEALSRELAVTLTAHCGIASGQVILSGVGSDAHREYTVLGQSVNLAARLVELARANETVVSDAVYRAVTSLIDAAEMPDLAVKGLDRPVKAWRLVGLRTQTATAQNRFVGRRAELRLLRGILEGYRETGKGQVIHLRGEAGIGKTRLIEEFAELAAREGFVSHTGLVLDFGVGRGRDAIRAIVRSLLGIPAGTDKRARGVAAGRAADEGLVDQDQHLFLADLLDVPRDTAMRAAYDSMDNETRNRGKQECVATLVQRLSRRQPLLVTVEDLHAADAITLAHLARLAAAIGAARALLLMTSRVEGDPLDSVWRQSAGGTALTTIDLAPLSEDDALAMAGGFLDVSSRLALNCVRRAEGNPMFLEQLLRSAETAETEDVPGSVQSLVLARVDRLAPGDKHALQAAAVLGQRFSPDLHRFLIENPGYDHRSLVDRHLIRPTGAEYLFAHALIWETVYGALLRGPRRELHRRAAAWFAERDPVLRAEHLDRAEDQAAFGAHVEAARWQAELFHYERALQLAGRAVDLAKDPDQKHAALMLRGECLREMGRPADSIDVYREALAVAPDEVGRCRSRIGLVAGMRVTDAFEEAFRLLDAAELTAREEKLERELSQIHYYRGSLCFPRGDIDGCLAQHELALKHATRAGDPECEVRALSGLGDAYYARGRMITALGHFRRCIELSRLHGYGRVAVGNEYMVAWTRLYLNEVGGALSDALAAVDGAVRVGHRRAEMVARLTAARVLVEKGDPGAAEAHCRRGLELADLLGARRFRPFLLIYVGRMRRALGEPGAAVVPVLQEALEFARETGIGFLGPWVLSTLARVSDEPEEAKAALAEGEQLLRAGCVGHNYLAFFPDAIEVALRHGWWDEAERFARALKAYTHDEPLPWAGFFARRGTALARLHRDGPSDDLTAAVSELESEAGAAGLLAPLAALARAARPR